MSRYLRTALPSYNNIPFIWLTVIAAGALLGLGPLIIYRIDDGLIPIVFAGLLFPFIALIFGDLEKILVAGIILEIPIQIDQSFFYNDEAEYYSALAGFNVSLTTLCLVALYALWFTRLLGKPTPRDTRLPFLSVIRPAPLIYVGISIASIAVATNKMLAIFEINLVVQALLIMLYLAFNIRTRGDLEFVLLVGACALFLQALIMLVLIITRAPFQIGTIKARIDYGLRVAGTVGSPNGTASYLTLVLAPMLGLLLTKAQRWYKPLFALIFVMGTISLLFTFSRGGWIAFTISLIILFGVGWRMGWVPLKYIVFLGLVATIVLIGFQDMLVERLTGDDGNSAAGRVPLMYLALAIIRDNLILGVGVNNFSAVWDPYLGPELSSIWVHIVHNKYLLVWSETGVPGIVAFCAFLITILVQAWRVVQSKDPFLGPIALGFFGAICGQMMHMNFDLFTGRAQVQMLWLTAGIVAAMSAIIRYKTEVEQ